MIRRTSTQSDRRAAALGAAFAILAGLMAAVLPAGQGLVQLSYDLPFLWRPDIPVDDVLLIYMDDPSHERLGQPWFQPWDRRIHAALIERLKAGGARAIAFDVLFDLTNSPTADRELIQAVNRHGNVILGARTIPQVVQGEMIGWKLALPFPQLREAAAWGVAEPSGEDKTVRLHYRGAHDEPSLAWRVAQRTMALPPPAQASRWMNYYGPPGALPFLSYHEILQTNAASCTVSNKVIFVGARYSLGFTGGLGTDDFRTPYTRRTGTKSPGAEINATAYLNLVRGDWLRRLPGLIETLLLALAGAGAGVGFARPSPRRGAGLAVLSCLLLAVAAACLAWQWHLWFPWLIVVAVQIPVAVGWSVLTRATQGPREAEVGQALVVAPAAVDPSPAVEAGPPSKAADSSLRPHPPVPDHVLLRCIGKGAYGDVWLARDAIGTYHAVKILYRGRFPNAAPFEREFKGIQRFTPISRSHPGFVHVLHVGRNDGRGYFYYIMELGDDLESGQQINPRTYAPKNLATVLDRHISLPVADCVGIVLQLAAALEHLHQQRLIHRDIKPANIIFVNGRPKLADIGLVTDMESEQQDVSYIGTKGYIPPEGPGTAAADVFSLGKVLYEMCMGRRQDDFPELPTNIFDRVEQHELMQLNRIILKACEPNPLQRYQTAAALSADLLAQWSDTDGTAKDRNNVP